jgi:hypothetical protein
MIVNLQRMGKLGEKVAGGPDLTESDLKNAKIASVKATGAKM